MSNYLPYNSEELVLQTDQEIDTRTHIKHIATEMFARRGYNGTSIRDITEAAGVTKPVLYYYFTNKEHLYTTIFEEAYTHFLNGLEAVIQEKEDFFERLRGVIHIYIYYSSLDENILRIIYGFLFGPREGLPGVPIDQWEKRHFQLLAQMFEEGMAQGCIQSRPVETVVCHFLGTVNIYIMIRLTSPDPLPSNVEETILNLLLKGIQ